MKIKRYILIFTAFANFDLIKILNYRFNFLVNTFFTLFWVLFGFIDISIIFGHVHSIAGWTYQEFLIIYGIILIIRSVNRGIVAPNINEFTEQINNGQLDLYLVKPISPLFLISIKKMNLEQIIRFLVACFFTGIIITNLKIALSPILIFIFICSVILSIILMFALFWTYSFQTFFFEKNYAIENIQDNMLYSASRPNVIYPPNLQKIFLSIIPLAYFAYIPTALLLKKIPFYYFIFHLLITICFIFLYQKVWNFSIKHYSSASS